MWEWFLGGVACGSSFRRCGLWEWLVGAGGVACGVGGVACRSGVCGLWEWLLRRCGLWEWLLRSVLFVVALLDERTMYNDDN